MFVSFMAKLPLFGTPNCPPEFSKNSPTAGALALDFFNNGIYYHDEGVHI